MAEIRLQGQGWCVGCAPEAWERMWELARAALPHETAGILLGRVDGGAVRIEAVHPLVPGTASATHAHLPAAAWIRADWEIRTAHPDACWVGWFHTHPGLGIFLSGPDLELHETKFHPREVPHATAWVLDPVAATWGAFLLPAPGSPPMLLATIPEEAS